MAAFIAKIVSKKILGETLQNNFGKEDPYFETVPATRLDGTPSKTKTTKRRKALPPGLSEHDVKILTKVKRRAYRLDMSLFSFMGVKFGWSSVIGFIPAVGDLLDAFMAMMVFRTCNQIEGGLPAAVRSKMMFNIIIDFFIGLVPFLGDIADAVFRANTKNAIVLEEHLREKGKKNLKAQGLHIPSSDPSDPDEFDRQEHAAPPSYSASPASRNGPHGNSQHNSPVSTRPDGHSRASPTTSRPQAQVAPEESRGSWFGFGKKTKPADVERGELRRHEQQSTNSSRLQKSNR